MAKKRRKRSQAVPHKKEGKPAKSAEDREWAGRGLSPNQRAFLTAYSVHGNLRRSAEASGVSRTSHREWVGTDPVYAKAAEEAKENACQAWEDEVRRRAVEGVGEAVYYQGIRVGTKINYSDTLLMFLLKGAMPEKYRERSDVRHEGGGEPIPVEIHPGRDLLKRILKAAQKPGIPGLAGTTKRRA